MIEAAIKLALFLGYMALCSRMKEIRRMFQYHGAEHKTIACYEAGEPSRLKTSANTPGSTALRHKLFDIGAAHQHFAVRRAALVKHRAAGGLQTVAAAAACCNLLRSAQVVGPVKQPAGQGDCPAGALAAAADRFEPEDDMIEIAIAAVTPVLPDDRALAAWDNV